MVGRMMRRMMWDRWAGNVRMMWERGLHRLSQVRGRLTVLTVSEYLARLRCRRRRRDSRPGWVWPSIISIYATEFANFFNNYH